MNVKENIRPARVAGSFYEGNAEVLQREIVERLARARPHADGGEIVAAAVPHAGYIYSADIAAPVFKALAQASFDTVVIIGHDFGANAPGIIGILCDFTAFRTPLGDVPVDTELCEALLKADNRFVVHNQVHRQEHSIEVQLPFLQTVAKDFKIVPILFGEATPEHCQRLAELLEEHRGPRRILVLSSTDLSHYPTGKTARELDARTVSFAQNFDLAGLCRWQSQGAWERELGVETPICSAGGLGTAIVWAKMHGANHCAVLRQGNSGDVSEDDTRVVGYASMLFVKQAASDDTTAEFSLTSASQKYLLTLARQTIAEGTAGHVTPPELPQTDELLQPAAVFVTLHKHGRLRGCIGTTAARMPLWQAVMEYAQLAAFEDPRFEKVTAEELPELDIEISVLSPMRRIASADEILPGTHGVTVRQGRRSGLFLPQVWEQLPDLESFMGYLCAEKAGLPWDAWKSPQTELQVFTVHAFQEEAR
ncbi:MAG: AmmeMemoRadiSam system protein B [Victivallales bacterium]|nr:AmmeMemoRadiSam system protein B [Victivallales bacterium]